MHAHILDCLALASLFVTVAAGTAPTAYNKPTTKKAGTWTYCSTITVTTTVPTVTRSYQAYDDRRITVTNSSTVTNTYTQYDSVVYDFTATITETSTYIAGTTIVNPSPPATSIPTTTVPTPAGFTPILSEFPYTASLKIISVGETTTMGSSVEYTPGTSTLTLTGTTTIGPQYTDQYFTIAKTLTVTTSSVVVVDKSTTVTSTRLTLPTHHAICDETSGNYVDHFPFPAPFGVTTYNYYGGNQSVGDTRLYTPHPAEFDFVETKLVADKVACCNFAMTQGLAAFGYWMPADLYGQPRCYVFNVKDKKRCQPQRVQFTLLDGSRSSAKGSGYFAFNGKCGQIVPDQHGYSYYDK